MCKHLCEDARKDLWILWGSASKHKKTDRLRIDHLLTTRPNLHVVVISSRNNEPVMHHQRLSHLDGDVPPAAIVPNAIKASGGDAVVVSVFVDYFSSSITTNSDMGLEEIEEKARLFVQHGASVVYIPKPGIN